MSLQKSRPPLQIKQDGSLSDSAVRVIDFIGADVSQSTPGEVQVSFSSVGINFSYETIATGVTITVPQYQQMCLSNEIQVDGLLILDGRVVLGVGE